LSSAASLESVARAASERRAIERVLERDRSRVFNGRTSPTDRMLYLCGPMSAYPDLNVPAFQRAARLLRQYGYSVLSPAEPPYLQVPQTDWNRAVRRSLGALLECDAVATVTPSGLRESKGAMLELHVASQLEMPVLYWQAWVRAAEVWVLPEESTK
jgi:hypothetical protein